MSLRMTSGFCHGMVLLSPRSGTRPTASRVRGAVWNSLQSRLEGAKVLDVFAGSGAVGIEALSRGANAATFVENDRDARKALEVNLTEVRRRAQKQGLSPAIQTLFMSAEDAMRQCPDSYFDILWLDPPYAAIPELLPPLVSGLGRIAAADSILVVESDPASREKIAALFQIAGQPWSLLKQKVYGNILVSFFEYQQQGEPLS